MAMRVLISETSGFPRGTILDRPGVWWDDPIRTANSLPLEEVVSAGLWAIEESAVFSRINRGADNAVRAQPA